MVFYITVLRALAAMLITNAHYNNVYPIEIIANGGLLGDVVFFAVSGFCLYNIKDKFFSWYKKRIIRIYPGVWLITLLYLIIRFYSFENMNILQYFIYPTYYHFIASIIVLYVIYYAIIKNKKTRERLPLIIGIIAIVQTLIYIIFYDKTYYHIDAVREPMIRFLFMEAMLLGAYFRQNNEKYLKNKTVDWILLGVTLVLYFGSKLVFNKGYFLPIQLVNQFILLLALYYVLRCFAGINDKLEKIPNKIKQVIEFIASITLEIYLVQYPIIPRLAKLAFPINWIAITSIILISAYLLHIVIKKIISLIERTNHNESINNRCNKI